LNNTKFNLNQQTIHASAAFTNVHDTQLQIHILSKLQNR